MAITPVEFGKFMKKHRRAKHITQKVLAEQIGVQTKSISYIERGKNYPSTDKLFKIATFWECLSTNSYMIPHSLIRRFQLVS